MRAKGVLRNLKRGNYAKVVAALTPGSHQLLKAMKHGSKRIRFVYASDRILRRQGGFDAVFCTAVLRSAGHYPFEIYQELALFLETLVRPGGPEVEPDRSIFRKLESPLSRSRDEAGNKTNSPDPALAGTT
jgi:hypothetical protein